MGSCNYLNTDVTGPQKCGPVASCGCVCMSVKSVFITPLIFKNKKNMPAIESQAIWHSDHRKHSTMDLFMFCCFAIVNHSGCNCFFTNQLKDYIQSKDSTQGH